MSSHRLRVLEYWWMLELFAPQKVPATTRRRRKDKSQVVEWRPGTPLPWERLRPAPDTEKDGKTWRHTVYLGVYNLESTYQALHRVFRADRDAYDERGSGCSACAGVQVDGAGRLVAESAVLSSCLWSVARIVEESVRPGPQWDAEFREADRGFRERVGELADSLEADEANAGRCTQATMSELIRLAHQASGIDRALKVLPRDPALRGAEVASVAGLASSRVVIESVLVRERPDGPSGTDFLNSYFLEDINVVRASVAAGRCPTALASYLSEDARPPVGERIDVMTEHAVVDDAVVAERIPAGRWPSAPEHTLSLRQQFAVNQALHDLAPTGGIMGVNGPPGTGKTTMLRDIVAGNVVERARCLADLSRAEDAFVGEPLRWKAGPRERVVRRLREELTGFEMVVASANNAAVENISTEIPGIRAIDARWRQEADYFKDIASALIRRSRQSRQDADDAGDDEHGDTATDDAAWGLVAARLGNMKHRDAFRSEFWFDKTRPPSKKRVPGTAPRMQSRLWAWAKGAPARSWPQARADFHRAEQRVTRLIVFRRDVRRCLTRLEEIAGQRARAAQEMRRLSAALDELGPALRRCEQERDGARARRDLAAQVRDRHMSTRPGVAETLLSLGRSVREWRAALASVEGDLRDAEEQQLRIEEQVRTLLHQIDDAQRALDGLREADARAQEETTLLGEQLTDYRRRLGDAWPSEERSAAQREMRTPWLDAEIDGARAQLFLAALRLHEDFLASTAGQMLEGLRAAMDVVGGQAPRNLPREAVRAAWQMLFLVVPLVSTTFASYGRMFAGLGQEDLGWLLIDEAGQAAPQYAVGAIWRSKRVVAVGDPLQLEPVVTMPRKAMLDIAAYYAVDCQWLPPRASVQTLVDRVARFGTTLHQEGRPVWVSAPLTVHRRCNDPMFTLCNTIAYDGIMISGVAAHTDPADLFDGADGARVTPSEWIDVPADERGSHLQQQQIARLRTLIVELGHRGVKPSQIIAISPFRAVARALEEVRRDFPGLQGGTIHTAQGREADVVVLVLGGDPDRRGAKAWASETVNLVNVAASRAKRRLYVIGDRVEWERYNYFSQLSQALRSPVRR